MSTLSVGTVKATTLQTAAGVEVYTCKAWVSFNGTGTVAIRASGNVSSITDNGAGDYTVNFTTALVDANFSFAVAAVGPGTDGYGGGRNNTTPTSSSIRIGVWSAPNLADTTYVTCTVFR